MSSPAPELDKYLEVALKAAEAAGALLHDNFRRLHSGDVEFKGKRDPVTRLDHESEALIVKIIEDEFPEHLILAEEDTRTAGENPFRWIIDPLDGTVNYTRGHPFFCTAIALEIEGRVRVGVVRAPELDETFHAAEGRGAFRNGKPARVSDNDELLKSILATGFAYGRNETHQNNVDNFSRLVLEAGGVRRAGSAAIDLAFTAAGILDGFWELHLKPWDVAAGAILVTEAGGKVTDFSGGDDYVFSGNVVASNELIHDDIIRHLTPFDPAEAL